MTHLAEERGVTFDTLTPRAGERAVLVGQTGCGKTTLARALLATRPYVVVLDTKGMLRWPEYRVCKSLDTLAKAEDARLIYRPSWMDAENADEMEAFFAWAYLCRHRTVYVDEMMGVTKGDVYPPHFGGCLTRGRELGIELWTATQRPKRVPQVALSESEHLYAFKLRLPQDRERVEECAGVAASHIAALPKHHFLYSRQDTDVAGPFHLTL